ncbi:MAG: hypothetical protein KC609_23395 [Myxococcales bacterium]|nr:hypothetical protein [Myxococcales bacterium]
MLSVALLGHARCGTDFKGETIVGDPRCVELCRPDQPFAPGYGNACSSVSVKNCIAVCQERIAGASTLCTSCLLEGAFFDQPTASVPLVCERQTAREPGTPAKTECKGRYNGVVCKFTNGNDAAEINCYKLWYPELEAQICKPTFEPISRCADACPAR